VARDLDQARDDIGGFIERVYNRQRLRSALAYLSPEEFEKGQPEPWNAMRRPTAPDATCP
jgi:transposase InsO family protein